MTKEKEYEEALYRILDAKNLGLAKEIASDALGVEPTEDEVEELDFDNDTLEAGFIEEDYDD
jgi:hypothetical protein